VNPANIFFFLGNKEKNDPILKAMKLKLGDDRFWAYYHDIAKREFVQTIGRGEVVK
jgi:hypothetical protein